MFVYNERRRMKNMRDGHVLRLLTAINAEERHLRNCSGSFSEMVFLHMVNKMMVVARNAGGFRCALCT